MGFCVARVMKGCGRGTNGHIAISANNVDRAIAFLKTKGVTFAEDTRKTDKNGQTTVMYLEKEFGGFAIHLVKAK